MWTQNQKFKSQHVLPTIKYNIKLKDMNFVILFVG